MTWFDAAHIARVARLARLELSQAERRAMQRDLRAILDYVEQLTQVEELGREPVFGLPTDPPPLRPDAPAEPIGVEAALAGAPRREGDGFGVPRVIGGH